MKDSHGRTIDYLRISLTDRCNFRCIYCMPEGGVELMGHDEILAYDEIVEIVREAAKLGIRRLRLTGGEPLVRKGTPELIAELNATPGIESIAMTTNGVLLPAMAEDLKRAGLSRVNISLDTLDEEQFARIDPLREAAADPGRHRRGAGRGLRAGGRSTPWRCEASTRTIWVSRRCPWTDRCTSGSSSTCPWARARAPTAPDGAART